MSHAPSDYDLALDLWDRPPRPPVVCPGCGLRAEPYYGNFCWRCWATGQWRLIERTTAYQDRARVCGLEGRA